MNNHKKGLQMFSVIVSNEPVSNDSDVKSREYISSVLKHYMDVFSEEVPKEPPPVIVERDLPIEL